MSGRVRAAVSAALIALAVLLLAQGAALEVPAGLAAAAVAVAFVPLAGARPERGALVIAAVVVAVGGIAAVARVADGIADARVEFAGQLDVSEIRALSPGAAPEGYGYLSEAGGVMTRPEAGGDVLALWSLAELAPWLLAAIVLGLTAPVLLAAERGDPFSFESAKRLSWIGVLLLVGVPAIAMVGYLAAQVASEGTFVSPIVEPELTLSLLQLLPGLLVLALAGVFHRGAELRDFERHAI